MPYDASFIRLAPDEKFVPAFALPEIAGEPVEAVLETHYRFGGISPLTTLPFHPLRFPYL